MILIDVILLYFRSKIITVCVRIYWLMTVCKQLRGIFTTLKVSVKLFIKVILTLNIGHLLFICCFFFGKIIACSTFDGFFCSLKIDKIKKWRKNGQGSRNDTFTSNLDMMN